MEIYGDPWKSVKILRKFTKIHINTYDYVFVAISGEVSTFFCYFGLTTLPQYIRTQLWFQNHHGSSDHVRAARAVQSANSRILLFGKGIH